MWIKWKACQKWEQLIPSPWTIIPNQRHVRSHKEIMGRTWMEGHQETPWWLSTNVSPGWHHRMALDDQDYVFLRPSVLTYKYTRRYQELVKSRFLNQEVVANLVLKVFPLKDSIDSGRENDLHCKFRSEMGMPKLKLLFWTDISNPLLAQKKKSNSRHCTMKSEFHAAFLILSKPSSKHSHRQQLSVHVALVTSTTQQLPSTCIQRY